MEEINGEKRGASVILLAIKINKNKEIDDVAYILKSNTLGPIHCHLVSV